LLLCSLDKIFSQIHIFFVNASRNFTALAEIIVSSINIGKRWCCLMEVTDVRLRRVNTDGRMKAICSITIDNEFVVHDIRVIDGNNGLFVAMPSKRTPDGEFRDIAHPISSSTREKIQAAVLSEYERMGTEEEQAEQLVEGA
jgi:stage V sporulation protein G